MSQLCVKIRVREINKKRCIDGVYLSVLGKKRSERIGRYGCWGMY